MDSKTQSRLSARAEIIKAIAHPTRLFIAERLTERDHCVCELTKLICADVSTVSKHLSILKSAGIVVTRKEGNKVYYHLKTRCILRFMNCIESVLENSVKARASVIGRKLKLNH